MTRKIICKFSVFFLIVLSFFSVPALAQDLQKDPENPIQILKDRTDVILKDLDENQTRQFQAIRASYGTIRGVQDVRALLLRAVKACTEKNPELKDRLETRFANWTDTVDPVIRQGENRLDKMILLQSYAKPSEVRAYLQVFDEAVIWRTENAKTVPVSDKNGCEKMIQSMDSTQTELPELLTKTLKLDKPLIIQQRN